MKTILVTGATSFIGLHLLKALLPVYRVFAIIRPDSPKKKLLPLNDNLIVYEVAMHDYGNLKELLKSEKIDCFIHLAWNGTRGAARNDEKIQAKNLKYSQYALESAVALGVDTFVSAGSQAEYGPWKKKEKLSETITPDPNTAYGKMKLEFYKIACRICTIKKIRFLEPRFFSLYGPGDFSGTMVMSILNNMLQNKPCKLTQGIQDWDFLYINDAVLGLMKLLQDKKTYGIYNFGSGESHPLKFYIEKMNQITKSSSVLNYGAIPYPSTGMVNVNPDVEKLKSIGWKPEVTFEEGIKRIINCEF